MWFSKFISDHSIEISLIAIFWIIGILIGRKISNFKTVFIKNPFAGKKSKIIDDGPINPDPFRYKREYVVNLILDKKKDFPHDDVNTFTVALEDIIANENFQELRKKIPPKKRKKKSSETKVKEKEKEEEIIPNAGFEDLEEMLVSVKTYK